MVLPIGGFMPIPLAMMIPFMATQSMVMGDAFGQAFQYGKRKISAMSNEEFNATTMEQLASQMFQAYQNIIPDLKESIKQSRSLQALIVTELLRLPTSIFQEVVGTTGDTTSIKEDVTPEEFEKSLNKPFEPKSTPTNAPGSPKKNKPAPTSILPPQQQAEKNLIQNLLSIQKGLVNQFIHTSNLIKAGGTAPKGAQLIKVKAWKATLVKLNAQVKAASLNLFKKQAQYKDKYGVWLS